jgi:SAM-dependent methyltransferase
VVFSVEVGAQAFSERPPYLGLAPRLREADARGGLAEFGVPIKADGGIVPGPADFVGSFAVIGFGWEIDEKDFVLGDGFEAVEDSWGDMDENSVVFADDDAVGFAVGGAFGAGVVECDFGQGRGVDVVCQGQDYDAPDNTFDTVISCECFEHNPAWVMTFVNMYRMTKPGGLIVMSCATTGRAEHGTKRTSPADAPFCDDYYKNLTEQDFVDNLNIDNMFSAYEFGIGEVTKDLYFYGIKK